MERLRQQYRDTAAPISGAGAVGQSRHKCRCGRCEQTRLTPWRRRECGRVGLEVAWQLSAMSNGMATDSTGRGKWPVWRRSSGGPAGSGCCDPGSSQPPAVAVMQRESLQQRRAITLVSC